MIELHRARLLAAGKGSKMGAGQPGAPSLHQNGSQVVVASLHQPKPQQTPREAAVEVLQTEDMQMKRFLQRLQYQRDDSRPGEASFGSTVPTALSRRMLQRQGAGYLDSTVAAITSAAADRFLATVLQQAVACRDQRLKGAELTRQAERKRKRHKRQYLEDADGRRRRKDEREATREEINLAAIRAAEALTEKSTGPSAFATATDIGKQDVGDGNDAPDSAAKAKKKKKLVTDAMPMNGLKRKVNDLPDDEASYDSIDEEEEYYQEYYNDDDDDNGANSEEDEEDDEMMLLRDLARPLASWDFHLEGKMGMDRAAKHDHEINEDLALSDDDIENDEGDFMDTQHDELQHDVLMENGGSDDGGPATIPKPGSATKKTPNKSPDEKKKAPARKASSSPLPEAHRLPKPAT